MRSDWTVYLRMQLPIDYEGDILFEIYPDENTLNYYIDKGYTIYYEDDYRKMVKSLTGVDFSNFNSIPFSIEAISPINKE